MSEREYRFNSKAWGTLPLSRTGKRCINALRRVGCYELRETVDKSDKALLLIPGLGPECLKLIRKETERLKYVYAIESLQSKLTECVELCKTMGWKLTAEDIKRILDTNPNLSNS